MTSKSAADIGESALLSCEAAAVPNVTFVWKKSGKTVEESGKKYVIRSYPADPLTYRSELTVHNVSRKDYGSYECMARNTEVKITYSFFRANIEIARPIPNENLYNLSFFPISGIYSYPRGFGREVSA